ncbi:hypothetical protein scyTo_0007813 [Scyliorhinus torazame]|uniref:Uncharacterized protein n=1 Tax=Scyliorhinus torazame TaxID=75743 RepID=A0A401NYQ8_SCYTO|nr:hypothetical protein [Scyliorhinus torazame]
MLSYAAIIQERTLYLLHFVSLFEQPTEAALEPQQIQAFDQLRRLYRGPSRLAILTELSRNRNSDKHGLFQPGSVANSVFQNENFQLRLSPPPAIED